MLAKRLYKCPLKGLLAFFTVVASSQIFPHTARRAIISWAKVMPFSVKAAMVALFFCYNCIF